MSEKKERILPTEGVKETSNSLSRREFLKDAGLIVGGATVGSVALVNACSGNSGATSTVTVTKTVSSGGAGATTTITQAAGAAAVGDLLTLNINGKAYYVKCKDNWTLAYVLREKLDLTGTKRGCDDGSCGLCTVLMDGRPVLSCIILAIEADKKVIKTIEGYQLAAGKLDYMQQAFVTGDAIQCGFCTPAHIVVAEALLAWKPKPTRAEVADYMAGTLCRCGIHQLALDAIVTASGQPELSISKVGQA